MSYNCSFPQKHQLKPKASITGSVKGDVKLQGKSEEMLTSEKKKFNGSDPAERGVQVDHLLLAASCIRQANSAPNPICPQVEEGEIHSQNQNNSSGSCDFDSVLKVGSAGTHSRLPPCAPTSLSSQTPGVIVDATKAVGKGARLVPVSYSNPQDLTITHFLPVCVNTAMEETCVKALVAEKNAEFNRKHGRLELP